MGIEDINLFVMDVDGTLTDGKIYISNTGEAMKAFSVKDGLRIKQLDSFGIIPVIITGRESEIVSIRAKELGIKEIHQGISDKVKVLNSVMQKFGVSSANVAYIGDDENDLPCFEICGHTACTQDASIEVKNIADYVCVNKGGDGAVREYLDFILIDKLKNNRGN